MIEELKKLKTKDLLSIIVAGIVYGMLFFVAKLLGFSLLIMFYLNCGIL